MAMAPSIEQAALFAEEQVPDKIEPRARPPTRSRAGTHLDHRWCHNIYVGKRVHGVLDESQRIYQTGGELSHFIYWKLRLVSFDERTWKQIKDRVDWVEVIDHDRNECWRIAMGKASGELTTYQAGIGIRVGIPMHLWDVYRADGSRKQIGEDE
jgi:hypothetical protein